MTILVFLFLLFQFLIIFVRCRKSHLFYYLYKTYLMKKLLLLTAFTLSLAVGNSAKAQDLKVNDLDYFETRGVNVLVYSNLFTGGFNDEKNSGIEIIHHGVRTAQGGAIRLSSTPEQWDLVPDVT